MDTFEEIKSEKSKRAYLFEKLLLNGIKHTIKKKIKLFITVK